MDSHLISSIVTLLLIACGVAIVTEFFKQPYTTALVLVGLLIACFKVAPLINISHDVTFTIILPPLLFYGAMHMDLEQLRNNWRSISLLAIPGVVCSTFLIGFFVHQFIGLEWIAALLFGALITPTDPISVLSILKKVGVPERLRVILEGESLFNDGTGVVVFSLILGIVTGHQNFELGGTLLGFITVAGGGIVFGFFIGYCVYQILKKINNHLLEVTITVVLTFGTPLLAEHFHLSGIIAIVVAGMIIGNYGRVYSMSKTTRETLDTFWEVIDFIINSILFLVIGIELQVINFDKLISHWQPILVVISAVLISRGIVVYPIVWFKNKISKNDIPWPWAHVLFWGGLKGSISIALVVGLPSSFAHRELFLILAFSVVLFTLVFQALTMKSLIKYLKIKE